MSASAGGATTLKHGERSSRQRARLGRRLLALAYLARRGLRNEWGRFVLIAAVAALARWPLGERWSQLAGGPTATLALLAVLVVTVAVRLADRLRTPPGNAAEQARSDVELGALVLTACFAVLKASGRYAVFGYPFAYLVVAFCATFFRRVVSLTILAIALLVELLLHRAASPLYVGSHLAFFVLFYAAHSLFLQLEALRQRLLHRASVDRAIERMRQEARDFRLIAAPLRADPQVRSRELDEERLAIGAVETIHQALFYTLELIKKSLDLHTCVLLWLDESGERLKIKEIVSESDHITETALAADSGAVGTVVKNRLLVNLKDPKHGHLPYYDGPEEIGAFIGVPVLEDGHLRGVLAADRRADKPFSIQDEALLTEAAEQILRAIKSERVFAAVERSKYEHERFFAALSQLNRALTPDDVCQRTFEASREICPFDLAVITTYDPVTRQHHVVATSGEAPRGLETGFSIGDSQSLVSMVVKNKHYLPAGGELRDQGTPILGKRIKFAGFESLIVLPLICADAAIGTYILATRRPRTFGKERREMLSVIANQVAISLANAQMYGRMEKMATTDGLTGLYNHRTFQERLQEMLARADRQKTALAVLLTDVDHFKKVNDTHGHPVGDQVLKGVAAAVQRSVRKVDLAARYGGEEFAVVLEGTDKAGAKLLADRIRTEVEKLTFSSAEGQFQVTISLGIAIFRDDGVESKELISAADQALYHSKRNGRNRATCFGDLNPKSQLKVV